MTFQKNDFIEIEFIGKIRDSNEVFDSNVVSELEKINPKYSPEQAKPFSFALGQNMFLDGVDNYFIGKNIEKFPSEFEIPLSAEKAFGNRNSKLVQLMPIRVFHEQGLRPVQGIQFNFDGRVGKVIAVSGGRVIVDFNNPLAGKEVIYNVKVLKKIEDQKEKIKSFIEFLFKKDFPFQIEDKKIIIELPKEFKQFAEMFKDKFKEIFDFDLEVKDASEEK